jgi:SpoIID/LytB domain protein
MHRLKTLLVTASAIALTAGTVSAASARMHFVPSSRDVVLTGHGFGHGIGMSQYGAEGAARRGKNHRQILRFYYPGTTIARAAGDIRVLITGDTTSDVKVSPRSGLSVRDLGDGAAWRLPAGAGITRWRITPGPDRVEFYRRGAWHRWTSPSGRSTLRGDGEFYASGPITLWVPAGGSEVGRRYRGALRAATPPGSSSRDTVNVVPLESYLRGVVPDEMPASWSAAALQAQAVAARTYAVRARAANAGRYYHICDTTSCQVYGGYDAEHPGSDSAIAAVAGQTLFYDGEPALTMFSSSSGGHTTDGFEPYLVAKPDPWDDWSGNPVHTWTKTLAATSIQSAYPSIGTLIGIDIAERDGNGQWGGRVTTAVLDGTRGDVRVSGTTLRSRFGLRSHWFRPELTDISRRWGRIGGAASGVGATEGVEFATEGGTGQEFVRGRIYASPGTGPRELWGPVLRKYLRLGGPGSFLGFPARPLRPAPNTAYYFVVFEHGRIYGSPTRPHVIRGAFLRAYARLGFTESRLRLPLSEESAVAEGLRQNFQGGYLIWNRSTGDVTVHYY